MYLRIYIRLNLYINTRVHSCAVSVILQKFISVSFARLIRMLDFVVKAEKRG